MENESIIGTLLLIITGLTTYKGLTDPKFFDNNLFETDAILIGREWKRIFTAGFLHVSWLHFGFNMIALLSFSWSLEALFGFWKFAFIYFTSMLGGSLLALFIHRNHGNYTAVGASGAVSGVIFSSIILFPDWPIQLIFIPIPIKGWVLGLIYIIITIFGIKNKMGNIGHEAHLGGVLTGVILTLFLVEFQHISWWVVAALLVPTIAFLILIVRNPAVLLVQGYWGDGIEKMKKQMKDSRPNKFVLTKQEELDFLLEKIREKGLKSLTDKEHKRLGELRKEL